MQYVPLSQVFTWTDEIRSEFAREEDQAIRQRNIDRGIEALSGKDACDRLVRCIRMRFSMWNSPELQAAIGLREPHLKNGARRRDRKAAAVQPIAKAGKGGG
jgi:hypothetical protein